MPEAVSTLLKWCFLGLVYIFFFRVLQATWSGSTTKVSVKQVKNRTPSKKKPARKSKRASANEPTRIAILEPPELAGNQYTIESEIAIGRSNSCHIVLDDSYISQLHARIFPAESGIMVEDLGSTNGTYLNDNRLDRIVKTSIGDRIRAGNILMELR